MQATTIGQEVAHSYGLEHVDEPGDIMNPYNAGGDASFIDRCIRIVSNQGIACGQQHQVHCGTPSEQNAHAELVELFGSAVPDTAAPTVSIVFPQDGDTFDAGAEFTIEANANDDVGIVGVELFNNGTSLNTKGSPPFEWEVSNVPDGNYELHVIASDAAGNLTMSNVVNISVGSAPPPAGGEDDGGDDGGDSGAAEGGGGDSAGDDGGADSGDGAGSSEDEDDDDGELPDGYGENDENAGCGCTTQTPGHAPLLLLGLFGLFGLRRRN